VEPDAAATVPDSAVPAEAGGADQGNGDQGGKDQGGQDQLTADADSGQPANPAFGDGRDGVLTVVGPLEVTGTFPVFRVTGLGASTATVLSSTATLAPGDEVLLANLQGAETDCTHAGNWEFLEVAQVSSTQITFTTPVKNTYASGPASVSAQRIVLQKVPRWSTVHIHSGGVLAAKAWDGNLGGVLVMRVSDKLTIDTGGRIDMTGAGFAGASAVNTGGTDGGQGESYCSGHQPTTTSPYLGGGGGGLYYANTDDKCGQGGGGAGHANPGVWHDFSPKCQQAGNTGGVSNGGAAYGEAALTRIFLGSGGGSGATEDYTTGSGAGGGGGGIAIIFARSLVVEGEIRLQGADGGSPPQFESDCGNGGGGAGGSLLLEVDDLSGAGLISATRGLGAGNANLEAWESLGGDGSDGRIAVGVRTAFGVADPALVASVVTLLCDPDPGQFVLRK
jgi:hypothetical protein